MNNVDRLKELYSRFDMAPQDRMAAIFADYERMISRVAKRYADLDKAIEIADLQQQAFMGFCRALRNYQPEGYGDATFKSYLYWHIQKEFQRLLPGDFMVVEIRRKDNTAELLPFKEFQRRKKKIIEEGATYIIINQIKSYEEWVEKNGRFPESYADFPSNRGNGEAFSC